MSDVALSPQTAAHLGRLRRRVTVLIALLVSAAVASLAFVIVRLDRQLRDEQIDVELSSEARAVVDQIGFDGGELNVLDPVTALSDSAALGIRPPVDEKQSDPTVDELAEADRAARLVEVVEDLEPGELRELLSPYLDADDVDVDVDGVDVEEAWELYAPQLVADPPSDVVAEATRLYRVEQAKLEGRDPDLETVLYRGFDLPADDDTLLAVVAATVDEGEDDPVRGDPAWLLGLPLRDGAEVRGAVVAVVDADPFDRAHDRLRNQVIGLAALVVSGATVAAWFVAARTIRPAARALAQQERFLADAAHELRTPVTAIRATAEAALASGRVDDGLRRVADLAVGASDLTDDLLTLARMDAERLDLQREPVRLDLLVESLTDSDPRVELRAQEVVVDGDPGLMERAVANLVANAVAHGGATAEQPAVVTVDDGGVTVADHGQGVPPSDREAVFDRFRSGQGSAGHGLGLPLARWIARAHGGDLTVDEPPGGGAAFHLRLGRPGGRSVGG